jgi:hypothetical protein
MRGAVRLFVIWLVVGTSAVIAAEPPGEDYPLPTRVRDRPQASLFIGPTGIGNPLQGGGRAGVRFAIEVPSPRQTPPSRCFARPPGCRSTGGDGIPLITDTITLQTLSVSVARVQPGLTARPGTLRSVSPGIGMATGRRRSTTRGGAASTS